MDNSLHCSPVSAFFSIMVATGCQELFEDGLANGDERTAAEEAAALAAKEAKGGTIKFGWVKGVLVRFRLIVNLSQQLPFSDFQTSFKCVIHSSRFAAC